ncbi:HAD family phosphatase [Candidatus Woesearchaeota archaeon]|nr:HAD family phosphatase [Candidatus Woesearchaeota archaeon]
MIKCILFDMGGVLFLPGTSAAFAEKMQEQYNKPKNLVQKMHKKNLEQLETDHMDSHTFWTTLLQDLNIPLKEEEHVKEIAYKKDHPNTEMIKLVVMLKKKYLVGMLTNNNREMHERRLQESDIGDLFDYIFTSYELGFRKPDPQIYWAVVKELNMKPEEIIFFDDDPENIVSAKSIGMHAILYESVTQMKREIKKIKIL